MTKKQPPDGLVALQLGLTKKTLQNAPVIGVLAETTKSVWNENSHNWNWFQKKSEQLEPSENLSNWLRTKNNSNQKDLIHVLFLKKIKVQSD